MNLIKMAATSGKVSAAQAPSNVLQGFRADALTGPIGTDYGVDGPISDLLFYKHTTPDVVSGVWTFYGYQSNQVSLTAGQFGNAIRYDHIAVGGNPIFAVSPRKIDVHSPWCVSGFFYGFGDYLSGVQLTIQDMNPGYGPVGGANALLLFECGDANGDAQQETVLGLPSGGVNTYYLADGPGTHYSFGYDGTTYRVFKNGQFVMSQATNMSRIIDGHIIINFFGDPGNYGTGIMVIDDFSVNTNPPTQNFAVPTQPFAV